MNNRHETPYRLQRDGFDEILVGWERIYDLTPGALKDILLNRSFKYDKTDAIISFPEWWKNDKEAFLPSVILNNIFGIIPYFALNQDLIFVRVVNLATNEVMETFPGDEGEAHLLFICKHILTYCKKVLRSWGKEQYKEFRYGMEWLRDPWHKENYPEAFQRPDVRIYDVIRYDRLDPIIIFNKAKKAIENKTKNNDTFNFYYEYPKDVVVGAVKKEMIQRMREVVWEKNPDPTLAKCDFEKAFWYIFDADLIYNVYLSLGQETYNNYHVKTYIASVANAIIAEYREPSVIG